MINTLSSDNNKESEWIEKSKTNPQEFRPLYEKYYNPVFLFINRRLNDMDQSADITQQVFLKALEKLGRYNHRGFPFGAWLFRIANNELIDFFRKNKEKRSINIDTVNLSAVCDEENINWSSEYLPALKSVLSSLNEEELMLIEMRFFEKRPFAEIAEIMNLKENNTKIKLYRLLDKIKPRIFKIANI